MRAGLVAAALFGCASYVGSDPPTRLPRDATVDEQASDDGANADAPPHTEAAMSDVPARCFWDPGWGCNPYGADPCAPSEGCALTDFDPIAPRAVCRAVGPRPLGALCDETDPSQRCARSFQCLFGRCAATCCGALDDARCAARDPRSACAVPTQSLRVWGCTLPGACDYRADDCPGGQSCFPTGRLGNAVCTVAGEAVVNVHAEAALRRRVGRVPGGRVPAEYCSVPRRGRGLRPRRAMHRRRRALPRRRAQGDGGGCAHARIPGCG